jgi:hypothetical protein
MQRIPTLSGTSGHFKGESFNLVYGKTITIGRSREADFSLKRTERYRTQSEAEREKDEAAQTVSGKHFQVTLHNLRSIEIKNLSPNGIKVDGKKVETTVIDDLATNSHEISFGVDEVLKLEMGEQKD